VRVVREGGKEGLGDYSPDGCRKLSVNWQVRASFCSFCTLCCYESFFLLPTASSTPQEIVSPPDFPEGHQSITYDQLQVCRPYVSVGHDFRVTDVTLLHYTTGREIIAKNKLKTHRLSGKAYEYFDSTVVIVIFY